jgi:hypothetical protein
MYAVRDQESPMTDYTFERETRTPFSEAYVVRDGGRDAGHVDLHFAASGIVFATLCVPLGVDDEALEELIAEIDERLVLTTDPYRDDFIVTVWRGAKAGVFSEDTDEEDDDDTNGTSPAR